MKRIKRLVFRLAYYPSIFILKPLDMLAHNCYNKGIVGILKMGGVIFKGSPRYISSDVYIDSFSHLTIGEDCVISKHVIFLTHDYSVTTALVADGRKPETDIKILGNIMLGDNVFVGLRTTFLPGTIVGDNVIIGAGSVVKGKIPSNTVAAGNPCKPIMSIEEYLKRKDKNWETLETEEL